MNFVEWFFVATLGACVLGVFLSAYMSARNWQVYSVRIEFIYSGRGLYSLLPSYGEMLYSPKHQLRWSAADWKRWIEAQRAKEAA